MHPDLERVYFYSMVPVMGSAVCRSYAKYQTVVPNEVSPIAPSGLFQNQPHIERDPCVRRSHEMEAGCD